MVNEPGKVPNLNTVMCRVYVGRTKNWMTNEEGNLDSPSTLVISLWKPWNFLGDGLIYEERAWRHKPNLLKFLLGHGEAIPWHHARRRVFQACLSFFYSWKTNKWHICGWLLPHISLKSLPIPCKRHENLLNSMIMVFQTGFMHFLMQRLFEFELCALMPRKWT
jgi:hypothetical protein